MLGLGLWDGSGHWYGYGCTSHRGKVAFIDGVGVKVAAVTIVFLMLFPTRASIWSGPKIRCDCRTTKTKVRGRQP